MKDFVNRYEKKVSTPPPTKAEDKVEKPEKSEKEKADKAAKDKNRNETESANFGTSHPPPPCFFCLLRKIRVLPLLIEVDDKSVILFLACTMSHFYHRCWRTERRDEFTPRNVAKF